MLSVTNSRKAMQNRIEYLKAKYIKPIDDSVLVAIALDFIEGRKRISLNSEKVVYTKQKVRNRKYSLNQIMRAIMNLHSM